MQEIQKKIARHKKLETHYILANQRKEETQATLVIRSHFFPTFPVAPYPTHLPPILPYYKV